MLCIEFNPRSFTQLNGHSLKKPFNKIKFIRIIIKIELELELEIDVELN